MYRIAFFGEPGTGKSSLAKAVALQLDLSIVEASEEVIYPAAALKALPSESAFIAHLVSKTGQVYAPISRDSARETSARLRDAYSPDIVAKVLHAKFVDRPEAKSGIFAGMRRFENAQYCRLHNDFVIYLKTEETTLLKRLQQIRGLTLEEAKDELAQEQREFKTREIENIANLIIDTGAWDIETSTKIILEKIREWMQMCTRCVNVAKNLAISFNEDGLCHICEAYLRHFSADQLQKELNILNAFKRTSGYDVMVGISGGKDSTATLHQIKKMGFNPLTFTFDTGYLPETTIPRAQAVARQFGVKHEVIDIRHYLRDVDLDAYRRLADLYEKPFTLETKQAFQEAYTNGRKHYSITCEHAPTFVRSCQICRRMVIRAYHAEAAARGIGAIVLGMNEWTNLSASQSNSLQTVSGMRVLQPTSESPAVTVFHLPFLLQRTIGDIESDLTEIGWAPPEGEDLIESNSNSCLLARSTERMAKRMLEFHPDSTRLAREVTVGFISKEQALAALGKLHPYKYSPREVLRNAGIL